jgi:hypothetical protein
MEYKLAGKDETGRQIQTVQCLTNNSWIPFAPDNTDYQRFKKEINEETARLQDADGKLYTKEQAKVFVSTLP